VFKTYTLTRVVFTALKQLVHGPCTRSVFTSDKNTAVFSTRTRTVNTLEARDTQAVKMTGGPCVAGLTLPSTRTFSKRLYKIGLECPFIERLVLVETLS